jgi:putative ATP-binding cassette transporter
MSTDQATGDQATGQPGAEAAGGTTGDRIGETLLGLLGRLRIEPSNWIRRLRRQGPMVASVWRLLAVALLAAGSGTAILLILNAESRLIESRDHSVWLALLFIAVMVIYRSSQLLVVGRACSAIEQALDRSRARIAGKLLRLSLRDVEAMTRGRLVDGLARHYGALSQSVMPLVWGFESVILAAFMLAYIFYLSVAAGTLTTVITGVLLLGYLPTARRLQAEMAATAQADAELSRLSESVVEGFKELRLDTGKGAAVLADFMGRSSTVANHRNATNSLFGELLVSGNSASYMLAAGVVFLLPLLSSGEESEVARIVTAVIFLLGPIGGIVGAGQQLATARFVLGGIRAFEREIETRGQQDPAEAAGAGGFGKIEAVGLYYTHADPAREDHGFAVSGIDMSLAPGRIVFVSGANGSGKTTALRLLSGLYPPDGGHLALDGRTLPAQAPQAYRELFATVFADFHVFAKPYGLDADGLARLEAALEKLGIRRKLPADLAQGYDPTALSTGQLKRLALALALAENRPILLLDEWAADQDPATREEFYRTMLPAIKAEGKAVIAVSHDDRYFDCADARYHMEDGRMRQVA